MIKSKEKTTFRYEEISAHLSSAIEEGTIPFGSRLPSLRIMSQRYNCAVSVVMQAYELLERQGLVNAIEKSGYFASNPRTSPLPEPQKEKYYLKSEEATPLSILGRIVEAGNDETIVPLGAGKPHESNLPIKSLKQNFIRILKEESHWISDYCDEGGHRELRKEIAAIMLKRGVSVSSREILITNGCTEALSLGIQSCSSPGDVIVTESPVFLGIIQILNQLKRRVIPIPTSTTDGMDLIQLESVLAREEVKAVIMTAIYQNPLGFLMKEKNRKKVINLAEKYGVTVIEDDVYNQCSFDHKEERPIKSFDREGDVIYCSSFSKTISPGMRCGWLIGGKNHESCRRLKMGLTLGGNPAVQQAVAEYLKSSRYSQNILQLQKATARQASELKQILISEFPKGTAITKPEGGFYFWVELPGNTDTLQLFEDAIKCGISTVPGQAFTTGKRYSNCLRISFASPITDETRKGVIKLG
ncbi:MULTISPECIES: PLP-dependent aminotransferase family protein, partial [unclassified Oceanispirochaeta]|uniref:aminotransferase-like domain-containing protein n=1 Tax=unclassified Oceanispirochaeta TaxID=2635722 RepID=UPI000E1415EA